MNNYIRKVISVNEDRYGCGYYRILWPDQIISSENPDIEIRNSQSLVTAPVFYEGVDIVRIQKMAHDSHLQYLKWFEKEVKSKNPVRLVYEADDIILSEDMPVYNQTRYWFKDNRDSIIEIMKNFCDEMTVTTKTLADYYKHKTGLDNINVIPNYVPKFWMDRFFSPHKMSERYKKFRRKPRILFTSGASHFDHQNLNGGSDDFSHIIEDVIKTVDDFEWIFLSCCPPKLKEFEKNGKIKVFKFKNIYKYPYFLDSLEPLMIVAPLAKNIFNECKSDIKLKESNALGIPCVLQNLEPYKHAPFKFNTGNEMIDLVKKILKDKSTYIKYCRQAYSSAQKDWLENEENVGKFLKCYMKTDNLPEENNAY